MTKGINYISQFQGNLGLPIHAQELGKALLKQTDNISLLQIDSTMKHIIKKATNFVFWYPNYFSKYAADYGLYMFEYTKIPPQFIEEINQLKGICVASMWAKKVLLKNNVIVPVHIVHGGVDTLKFNSKDRRLDNEVFRFLSIGKAEERKGTRLLIETFNEAFRGNPKVRLTLSIDNPHIENFKAEEYLANISKTLKYPTSNIDIVHFANHVRDLYNTHHAAVFPAKAEGIGLAIVESMASGVPTICSFNSGITEYATDDTAILLNDLTEEEVYDPVFFPEKGKFGTWRSPTKEQLVEKLLLVYNDYDKIKHKGERAEILMKNVWTWEQSATQLLEVLNA